MGLATGLIIEGVENAESRLIEANCKPGNCLRFGLSQRLGVGKELHKFLRSFQLRLQLDVERYCGQGSLLLR